MAVTFFAPDATVPNTGSWQTNWTIQSVNPSTTKERVQGLGADGDEVASALYGERNTDSVTYKCYSASGNLALPKIGDVDTDTGWHIDSVALTLSASDYPTIVVGIHKHGAKKHTACRTYTPSLTIPAGRGIPAGVAGFTTTDIGVGISAFAYNITATHVDATDGNGDYLAADNCTGMETVSMTLTGTATITSPTGWDCTSDAKTESNTSNDTESLEYTHALAHDTAE